MNSKCVSLFHVTRSSYTFYFGKFLCSMCFMTTDSRVHETETGQAEALSDHIAYA